MLARYDVVVIGSGFGGAVTACRLAEAGYSVLVLERGRRWDKTTFPRKPGDDWLWNHDHPERCQGWIDFRLFPSMAVVQGAGVGGGSLVYANVSVSARPDTFDAGWPPEITFGALEPHYRAVKEMLGSRPIPESQWPERTRLLKLAAERDGAADRFERLDLAVSFSDDWNAGLPDPYSPEHSKPFVNAHGKLQGTCIHLGNCDIGCDVGARNSLDLNYLACAESRQAEVWPLHIARVIEPLPDGYRVRFERIENRTLIPGEVSARIVILGAGAEDRHARARQLSDSLSNLMGWGLGERAVRRAGKSSIDAALGTRSLVFSLLLRRPAVLFGRQRVVERRRRDSPTPSPTQGARIGVAGERRR
jgi:cholesterol oxidase